MWWRYLKKAKEIYSWLSFGAHVVGFIGLGSFAAGITATAVGVVFAIVKGVPWPIVVMAGFCTFVAAMYLAALPVFVSAAIRAVPEQKTETKLLREEPPHPNYDAWKFVDVFTLLEAAFLWNDQIPVKVGYRDISVDEWLRALKSAVTQGQLEFVMKVDTAIQHSRSMVEANIRRQKLNPTDYTEVTRDMLVKFATANGHKPKFLFVNEPPKLKPD